MPHATPRHSSDLIRALAKKHRRPEAHYRQALKEILAEITEQLAQGDELRLIGFGTFYTRVQPGGIVKDIRSGKPHAYSALRVAGFHVGDLLKRAVKKPAKRQFKVGWPRKKASA